MRSRISSRIIFASCVGFFDRAYYGFYVTSRMLVLIKGDKIWNINLRVATQDASQNTLRRASYTKISQFSAILQTNLRRSYILRYIVTPGTCPFICAAVICYYQQTRTVFYSTCSFCLWFVPYPISDFFFFFIRLVFFSYLLFLGWRFFVVLSCPVR